MKLSDIAIEQVHLIIASMIGIMALGLLALRHLPTDQYPPIEFPVVVVSTLYTGASPSVVEDAISQGLEAAISGVAGVRSISSKSLSGQSIVIVEFSLDVKPETAQQSVRDAIHSARKSLPKEAEDPVVQSTDPNSLPMLVVSVEGPGRTSAELTDIAEESVKRRLQSVKGVGTINIVGETKREVSIALRRDALQANRVSAATIRTRLEQAGKDRPLGQFKTDSNELTVLAARGFSTVGGLASLSFPGASGPVQLSDLGEVTYSAERKTSIARVNGKEAVTLELVKSQGESAVEMSDAVRRELTRMEHELPPGVKVSVVRDSSHVVRRALTHVEQTFLEGAVLTIAVVLLFLRSLESTIITGIALPVSVLGALASVWLFGFSINLVTMLALTMVVGVLIDDAIIVRENITRHIESGKPRALAARLATKEIGLAVVATTLCIVIVFLPIGLMDGMVGRVFMQFGITVSTAVLLSMLVAFTVDPMLSANWDKMGFALPAKLFDSVPLMTLARSVHMRLGLVSEVFASGLCRLLEQAMRKPKRVVCVAIILATGLTYLVASRLGGEFIPSQDGDELLVQIETPPGASLTYTENKATAVEKRIASVSEVAGYYASINGGRVRGANFVSIYCNLKSPRSRTTKQIEAEIRRKLAPMGGINVRYIGEYSPVLAAKAIQLSITGDDVDVLSKHADLLAAKLARIQGVTELESSLGAAKQVVAIEFDDDVIARLDLGITRVLSELGSLMGNEVVTTMSGERGKSVNVRLKQMGEDAFNLSRVEQLPLGQSVPSLENLRLADVARVRLSKEYAQINRRSLRREVLLSANVSGVPLSRVANQINTILHDLRMPPGYEAELRGTSRDMQDAFSSAVSVLVLSGFLMYLVLASLFRSFLVPVCVMVPLPLSVFGALFGLYLFDSTLNLFSVIGVIFLFGLAAKNAILVVDAALKLNDAGVPLKEALMVASKSRLRPVAMTTVAMIAGMLPLAVSAPGTGASGLASMAEAVVGGLLFSSLLSLVLVPATCAAFLPERQTGRVREVNQKEVVFVQGAS